MTPHSNAELVRDVKETKEMVTNLMKTVNNQGNDIVALNQWRLSTEAAHEAVEKYKAGEAKDRRLNDSSKFINTKAELVRMVIPLIIALTAFIYAYTQRIH